jgi:hypothetical protein
MGGRSGGGGAIGGHDGSTTPSPSLFSHTGAFQVTPEKRPHYVVPDLTGFELKPYVARGLKKPT